MSTLQEAGRHYEPDDEIDPITGDAEDPDFSEEQAQAALDRFFKLGFDRRKELEQVLKKSKDGTYAIPWTSKGGYGNGDFGSIANFDYLKEKYPWLHRVDSGLGLDISRALRPTDVDQDDPSTFNVDFEQFLGKIPHEDWVSFLTDVSGLEDGDCLDPDREQKLENEAMEKYVKEDVWPDLIKEMMKVTESAYHAYIFSKIPESLVWEWMSEIGNYPDREADSFWMDADEYAKKEETQIWFLENMPEDKAGWLAAKREVYDGKSGELFDKLFQKLARTDPEIEHVYARMDNERMFSVFLDAFPDEPVFEGGPYWYFWSPIWNAPKEWHVGYEPELHNPDDAFRNYLKALENLEQQPWFIDLLRNWFRGGPKDHPEFKFEALQEAEPLDPDDPDIYLRHGGGANETVVYEDDAIVVFEPRDEKAFNYHVLNAIGRDTPLGTWNEIKYHNIYQIVAKENGVLRDVCTILGYNRDLYVFDLMGNAPSLDEVLEDPDYGKSVRRVLLKSYRSQEDPNHARILYMLGGMRELRRAAAEGYANIDDVGLLLGMEYARKKQFKLAAKAFKRPLETITPQGVWLRFSDFEDLAVLFKNEGAAKAAFNNDTHNWFDYLWEIPNRPDVEDVIPFLGKKAIDHIRSVMINRKVWFPDEGEDRQGAYVYLTKENMANVDDDTMLDWLVNVSDEDEEDQVFADIIDAIRKDGVRMLEQASADNVSRKVTADAIAAINGTEHKFIKVSENPEVWKLSVFVPWEPIFNAIQSAASLRESDPYAGSLEDLMLEVNRHTDNDDFDTSNYEASWRQVDKENSADLADDVLDLEAPEPPPGSPGYDDPNQLKLPLPESVDDPDDPEMLIKHWSGFPMSAERAIKRVIFSVAEKAGLGPLAIDIKWEPLENPVYTELIVEVSCADFANDRLSFHQDFYTMQNYICNMVSHHLGNGFTYVSKNMYPKSKRKNEDTMVFTCVFMELPEVDPNAPF